MISRSKGQQTIVCDSCGDPLDEEFDRDRFQAMLDHAHAEKWSIRTEGGEWKHYCPGCVDAPVESKLDRQRKLLGL